jgi:hypothetical protein
MLTYRRGGGHQSTSRWAPGAGQLSKLKTFTLFILENKKGASEKIACSLTLFQSYLAAWYRLDTSSQFTTFQKVLI